MLDRQLSEQKMMTMELLTSSWWLSTFNAKWMFVDCRGAARNRAVTGRSGAVIDLIPGIAGGQPVPVWKALLPSSMACWVLVMAPPLRSVSSSTRTWKPPSPALRALCSPTLA